MSDLGAQPPLDSTSAPSGDANTSFRDADQTDSDQAPVDQTSEPAGPDALAEALRHVAEARQYLAYLLAVEVDRLRLRLRRAAIWAILGLAALAVLLAVLMTAAGLLLWGLADLIARALDQPMWLGALVTGGGILLIGILALLLALWSWNLSAFNALRRRYAQRRRRQREQFGRSIDPHDDESTR